MKIFTFKKEEMQNDKRYPFKYLDAYSRDDKDFYFGREKEVKELYEMTRQSNLLLVYGASGTGKTSLIQCGLSNCFESHKWLALQIRRGTNINNSLEKVLDDAIGVDMEYFIKKRKIENDTDNLPISEKIKALRMKYFRPVYLIFDQFEELYTVNKDNKDERLIFYKTVKELLSLNQPVKIIISMREEYLGYLYDFEKEVPDILRKKLRIEPMILEKVRQVLYGINDSEKSLVTLQKNEEEALIRAIFEKLNEDKISIELPYLQVLLDKLYREKTGDKELKPTTPTTLTLEDVNKLSNIDIILCDMLNELVSQLGKEGVDSNAVEDTLSRFVTEEGTKKPIPVTNLNENEQPIVDFFVCKRILRLNEKEQVYEIFHDSLAKKIHSNRPEEEKTKLQIEKTIKDVANKKGKLRVHFTAEQISQIDLFLDKLNLTSDEKKWIEQSRRKIEDDKRAEEVELIKKKRQLRITSFALVAAGLLLLLSGWQWMVANTAKQQAKMKEEEAISAKNDAVNALYEQQKLKFEDLERRVNIIKYANNNPDTLLIQMQKIAYSHPDSIKMKKLIENYK